MYLYLALQQQLEVAGSITPENHRYKILKNKVKKIKKNCCSCKVPVRKGL